MHIQDPPQHNGKKDLGGAGAVHAIQGRGMGELTPGGHLLDPRTYRALVQLTLAQAVH